MEPLQLIGLIGIVFVVLILGVVLLMPAERRRRKKKRQQKTPEEEIKEWQQACLKLEKHVQALRQDVDSLKRTEKLLERDLLLNKEKNKKLQEKLSQERGWQEKEHADVDKKAREVQTLKDDLTKSEETLGKEHSQRLFLEREAREIKESLAKETEAKRALESQILKLKAQADAHREEIAELKESNQKLSKQHEDKTFVSKSEYDKLEQMLKDKEKEIEKLKRQVIN